MLQYFQGKEESTATRGFLGGQRKARRVGGWMLDLLTGGEPSHRTSKQIDERNINTPTCKMMPTRKHWEREGRLGVERTLDGNQR